MMKRICPIRYVTIDTGPEIIPRRSENMQSFVHNVLPHFVSPLP